MGCRNPVLLGSQQETQGNACRFHGFRNHVGIWVSVLGGGGVNLLEVRWADAVWLPLKPLPLPCSPRQLG